MTKFQDLCNLYGDWDKRRKDYRDENYAYLLGFVHRMKNYFGFPEYYISIENSAKEERNYIEFYSLVFDEKETFQEFEYCSSPYDAVSFANGNWQFGLGFTLEKERKIYPKTNFLLGFASNVFQGKVFIKANFLGEENKEFNFKIGDKPEEEKVFEWIFKYLENCLRIHPKEQIKMKGIGFEIES